ncbi:Cytochrome oxidase complex assembly protein 1 [Tenacibaculum sp. MAR_2009_124]|uniref:cytochrome c oxidase assembly factor Coa1 family protein n=1 Tax=Tenacibaculum sp. MAR_2009_124 TaxID=1250059 RepID=UPI000898FC50|nr:cytochrome c oxidase assembly factor Coa1 family protein [Tenacibaculum sp. MAR_2009_124]SEC27343.1 Cytochrome oxidase complex assembly protein 1 [Tenacibaculum sp. MAR_2009_124]
MSDQNQKSWFSRNWLWFIPVSGCLGIILLFIFGIGAAIFGVSNMINNATPVEYALEQANSNNKVLSALGNPIEKDGFPNGNISLHNNDGKVDFSIPIKGSKGEGFLIVRGIKTDGEWAFEDLYVEIKETQEQINLLEKALESI